MNQSHPFDEGQLRAFLDAVMDPSHGCAEMRVFHGVFARGGYVETAQQYTRTLAGWYDNPHSFVVDAKRLRGVSGFITVNPVNPALLARSDNRLAKAKHATQDVDISCICWLFIDIDPRRPADTSATNAELKAAIACRDAILAAHPDLAASSLWGRSGNGGWILVRVPNYSNELVYQTVIAQATAILKAQWDDAVVEIDLKTKNPSRVMCLPGTLKCKGSNRPERPWRLATLDSPGGPRKPFDLMTWVETHKDSLPAPVAPEVNGAVHRPPSKNGLSVADRALRYVLTMPEAVAGQKGHDRLYAVACVLVDGFGLGRNEAIPILRAWNQAKAVPPESDYQIEHKIDSAIKNHPAPGRKLAEAERPGRDINAEIPRLGGGEEIQERNDEEKPSLEFTDQGNGKRLIALHGERVRYIKQFKDWMIFDGQRWRRDETCTIESFAKDIPYRILTETPPSANSKVQEMYKEWSLSSQAKDRIFGMILLARSEPGISIRAESLDSNPYLFNLQNGTLDLETMEFRAHRARDLITKLSPVVYDPAAKAPRWERFEREVFGGDESVIQYMRRSVGAALVGSDKSQDLNILHGEGSNGKNRFLDTLRAIFGDYGNVAENSLLLLSSTEKHPTGLADLFGCRFVMISETDDGRRLAESLLKKLTGDATIKARRVHENFFEFRRSWRIFMATNHRPKVKGQDHALWRRLRLVPFSTVFVDPGDTAAPAVNPPHIYAIDQGLEAALRDESSGILNLLIQGCRDWLASGLAPPESVVAATGSYRTSMDTVSLFLSQRAEQFHGTKEELKAHKTEVNILLEAYRDCCEENGMAKFAYSKWQFGHELKKRGFQLYQANKVSWRLGITLRAPGVYDDETVVTDDDDIEETLHQSYLDDKGCPF